jgi:hypothetical protein
MWSNSSCGLLPWFFIFFFNGRSWCSGMLFLRYCGLCLVLSIAETTYRSGCTLVVCMQPIDTWHLYGNVSRYQGVDISVLCRSTVNGLRKTLVTTVEVKWMFCTNTSVFYIDNKFNIYVNTWREVLILLIVIETVSYLSRCTMFHIQETWDFSLGTEPGCNDGSFYFIFLMITHANAGTHPLLHIFPNS